MLSEKDKREMLEDGLSRERREAFLLAERKKPKGSRDLNEYIAFLNFVQKFKPFEHERRVVTSTERNIL